MVTFLLFCEVYGRNPNLTLTIHSTTMHQLVENVIHPRKAREMYPFLLNYFFSFITDTAIKRTIIDVNK